MSSSDYRPGYSNYLDAKVEDEKRVARGRRRNVKAGVCRSCSCTDQNCAKCIERTGQPCYWVEPDLCSACASFCQGFF